MCKGASGDPGVAPPGELGVYYKWQPHFGMSSLPRVPGTRAKSATKRARGARSEGRPASATGDLPFPRRGLRHSTSLLPSGEGPLHESGLGACGGAHVIKTSSSSSDLLNVIQHQRTQHYRPLCAGDYVHKYLCRVYDATMGKTRRHSKFPFMDLPDDCMLKVFSFLDVMERGRAAKVCRKWNALTKQSSLWTVVDLTSFPLCPIQKTSHVCGADCYKNYRVRVKKFMRFLQSVHPVMRRLSFAFDIYDQEDRWLESIEHLIQAAHCQELAFAHVNWKETPIKPFWVEQIAWSVSDYNEFMHRHRHRQRRFIQFFDLLTTRAPNIQKMVMPFDWSQKSLEFIGRLKNLNTLVLEKYFVFQNMSQASLDILLEQLPKLERLVLEVWTPSGKGLILYQIRSTQIVYLDVSHCRGFYIGGIHLPGLRVFKVTRHPWNGPLTCADSINLPCIYEVLKAGAPNLKQLNEHTLQANWAEDVSPELQTVLQAVCSCRRHKSGWTM